MKRNKVALIYGFGEKEKEKIEVIVKRYHLHKLKVIDGAMAGMKVGDILAEKAEPALPKAKMPEEKVVLFNDMSDEEIQKYIKHLRMEFKPLPILAVITETSEKWTFEYLVEHLVEEREKVKASMK
ncbi:MAG TPA: DUF3783 domain-containing protein [Clostridiaceae bacterium]